MLPPAENVSGAFTSNRSLPLTFGKNHRYVNQNVDIVEVSVIFEGYYGFKFNDSGIYMNLVTQTGDSVWPWNHGSNTAPTGIEEA
jgi:hypothetical protein